MPELKWIGIGCVTNIMDDVVNLKDSVLRLELDVILSIAGLFSAFCHI